MDSHEDNISLLYLIDSEATLQAIHKWIGCGAKLNLATSPDADVLKKIMLKLQTQRGPAGAATLLVKVKSHRGDPLNEEADIRAEMGRRKEQKEFIRDNPTNRTVYQWEVGPITRSTTWTNTVRNRFRQKAGEIEAFRALEIGAAKWCKEHIPRKGNDLTDEGLLLLDDMELWWEKSFSHHFHGNFSTAPKRSNFSNLYKRLVPTQGRKPRQAGGVAKENNSPISGSAEDVLDKELDRLASSK